MKPIVIRRGNVRVRVFHTPVRHVVRGAVRVYDRYEVRWTDLGGVRHRPKFSDRTEAVREATAKAEEIARGGATTTLVLADVASFRAGVVNLHGTGLTLELATADVAAAKRIVRDKSMTELAEFYKRHQPRTALDLTTAAAVATLLADVADEGVSDEWRRNLQAQLDRFAQDFPGPISEATAVTVKAWHLGLRRRLKKGGAAPMHPRTKNNHLTAVKQLFSSPGLRLHPERQAILDLKLITVPKRQLVIWKPAEFRTLLETAALPYRQFNGRVRREVARSHEHLIPVLVLGGFGRLRASEIRRVLWEKINLKDGRLFLRVGQTKTKRWRLIELPECAVAWLKRYAKTEGKVWPWGTCKFNADLRALAKRCGFAWRDNSLRKSAVTYDHVRDPDLMRVSSQAGNSPTVLEREYIEAEDITVADADAWYAIFPPKRSRVIVPLSA